MDKDSKQTGLTSTERRRFLKLSAGVGVTAAMVALSKGALGSEEASAQVVRKEAELKAAATYSMILGTAYAPGVSRSYPIMQLDFKENIQNTSRGKIYVRLAPGGQVGASGALARKVQKASIQAGQCSISNFSPFVPEVDLINIPYWCSENQKFVNLVTSAIWKKEIHPNIEAKGFKPLWYPCIDPRTTALGKRFEEPIKTPEQIGGIKFRIPNSIMLQRVYRLLGANPILVEWVEAATAIRSGYVDALDPAVGALYVFGFRNLLSHITFTDIVHDAQIYFCNLEWYSQLPQPLKASIDFASEMTMRQNHAQVPAARAHAEMQMTSAGVKLHRLSPDEKAQWKQQVGAQLAAWNDVKKQLAGSLTQFDKFKEAADTLGNYYVPER
ncbi:MAG: TRAP transporter substrate-binding protein [Deltaproteobacteria bacterium]|jgi:TRAP-type C4-dicarboxylate transport system substrate-binding protein|nr:TRAP transporter substrate-binding protein [Deltaproteobacteria bacterium]